jgi:hypothetical protein
MAAVLYELPMLIAVIMAAFALLISYKFVLDRFLNDNRAAAFIFLAVMDVTALALVFWAASYFPKRIIVYADRVRFKMIFKDRDVRFSELDELKALSPEDARKTFFTLRHANLTPAVKGAVALTRKAGRAWVFSPDAPDQFVAAVEEAMRRNRG